MDTTQRKKQYILDATTVPNSVDRLSPQRPPAEGDKSAVSRPGENITDTKGYTGKHAHTEPDQTSLTIAPFHTLELPHTSAAHTSHTLQSNSSVPSIISFQLSESNTSSSTASTPSEKSNTSVILPTPIPKQQPHTPREKRLVGRNKSKPSHPILATPAKQQVFERAARGRFRKKSPPHPVDPPEDPDESGVGVAAEPQSKVCYVCNKIYIPRLLNRLYDRTQSMQNAAIMHRTNLGFHVQPVNLDSKICNPCLKHAHNFCYDKGVIWKTVTTGSFRNCVVCKAHSNLTKVSFLARINAYVTRGIFIMPNARVCKTHLTTEKIIIKPCINGLPYKNLRVFMSQEEMGEWIEGTRDAFINRQDKVYRDEEDFTDEDFRIFTGISKANFLDMYSHCTGTVKVKNANRKCTKQQLLMFLSKMRQGISDSFLKAIFKVSTRQSVSNGVKIATEHLKQKFLPLNLGVSDKHITRQNLIDTHVTDFANGLYNIDENNMPKPKVLIIYVDGTYLYVPKGRIHRVLRQTFCYHKGRHLIKPIMIVLPDGYILDVHGPYFSDSKNNDANCLIAELKKEIDGLKSILQPEDVFVVDRGYRDALNLLTSLGIHHNMPSLLPKGNKQLSCEEANLSRLVTSTRFIVETRNGHIKSVFKLFQEMIPAQLVPVIGTMFKIACAIINKYYAPVLMEGKNAQLAHEMVQKVKEVNVVQCLVEQQNLTSRTHKFFDMDKTHLPGFPKLSEEYLRNLMYGSYQLRLSMQYIQDIEDRDSEFTYAICLEQEGLLRAKLYSKHSQSTKYTVWIAYVDSILDSQSEEETAEHPITGYHCTCKSGARTLGSCTHVATVLWYMGYARHEENSIKYPSYRTLVAVLDAGERPLPDNAIVQMGLPDIIDPQDYLEVQLVEEEA